MAGHNSFTRFKKFICTQPPRELKTCLHLLDTLQTYRNFSAACGACPDLDTESREAWLAVVISDQNRQAKLGTALVAHPDFGWSVQRLKQHRLFKELLDLNGEDHIARGILMLGQCVRMQRMEENLLKASIEGIPAYLRDLGNSIGDEQGFLDHFFEGKVTLGFATPDSAVVFRPCGAAGPDQRVDFAEKRMFVEVTRLREDTHVTELLRAYHSKLVGYPHHEEGLRSKIEGKLRQAIPNEINLLVLFSESHAKEDTEFPEATSYLDREVRRGLHPSLSAVVFASKWRRSGSQRYQSSLWRNPRATRPLPLDTTDFICQSIDAAISMRI